MYKLYFAILVFSSLFRTLTNLTYLNLANNQLTFPQRTEIFSSQYKLKIIILDSNEKLDAAYNSSTSILYYCHLIQQISARKTNIKKIFEDWLSFEALEHLDLRDTLVGGKIRVSKNFINKITHTVTVKWWKVQVLIRTVELHMYNMYL